MSHPSRFYDEKRDYEHQISQDFNNIVYWRLLYRAALTCIGLFLLTGFLKQHWLPQISYLNMMDVTALITVLVVMAELVLRRYHYVNKSWNYMILLASFMIGLSSLGVFYPL